MILSDLQKEKLNKLSICFAAYKLNKDRHIATTLFGKIQRCVIGKRYCFTTLPVAITRPSFTSLMM